ncbi:MAG: hypothetical protein QOJ65_287 [Fimbriimonadaceae bacterium]|nr:hypothetical protein [Fimbriimonadaceae bacterium]
MTARQLRPEDIPNAVALQRACFPAPFPEDLLWNADHLAKHLEVFPEGQFIAEEDGRIVGSASSCIISEENWDAHRPWAETVGGPFVENHDPAGTTLYGIDIGVHPAARRKGVGRALYQARFNLVREKRLIRYGTACRLPGYIQWGQMQENPAVERYASEVVSGKAADRTLTPLLRYGLRFLSVIHDYMEDKESANAAALLEWKS